MSTRPPVILRATVTSRTIEADGIVSLDLRAPDGGPLPAFTAGAHIDVHLGSGLVRQYSLCNAPWERDRYRIAVLRDAGSRGGSAAVHDTLHCGASVEIGVPRNSFPLIESPHALLFAGGIGITPLLSMAEQLSRDSRSYELHYCTRSESLTAFREQLAAPRFGGTVSCYHDDGSRPKRFDAADIIARCPAHAHLYVCGPTGYIAHVLEAARRLGFSENRLHSEYFGTAPGAIADRPFTVELARRGISITVPADKNIATALADHGVRIPTSCRQGVCGTCITGVLAGICDHRDHFLTSDEHALHDQIAACCSRAAGDLLVLDL